MDERVGMIFDRKIQLLSDLVLAAPRINSKNIPELYIDMNYVPNDWVGKRLFLYKESYSDHGQRMTMVADTVHPQGGRVWFEPFKVGTPAPESHLAPIIYDGPNYEIAIGNPEEKLKTRTLGAFTLGEFIWNRYLFHNPLGAYEAIRINNGKPGYANYLSFNAKTLRSIWAYTSRSMRFALSPTCTNPRFTYFRAVLTKNVYEVNWGDSLEDDELGGYWKMKFDVN